MTERFRFCALVELETSDPRLTAESIEAAMTTAGGVARLRRAVLQHMPRDVERLVMVLPVEHARLLTMLHEAVGDEIGQEVAARPPPGYVPPTRD